MFAILTVEELRSRTWTYELPAWIADVNHISLREETQTPTSNAKELFFSVMRVAFGFGPRRDRNSGVYEMKGDDRARKSRASRVLFEIFEWRKSVETFPWKCVGRRYVDSME